MSQLFAAVLLLSSPGCPHEEPNCLTETEYVCRFRMIHKPGGKPIRYVNAISCNSLVSSLPSKASGSERPLA
jgi:hypothetical protein